MEELALVSGQWQQLVMIHISVSAYWCASPFSTWQKTQESGERRTPGQRREQWGFVSWRKWHLEGGRVVRIRRVKSVLRLGISSVIFYDEPYLKYHFKWIYASIYWNKDMVLYLNLFICLYVKSCIEVRAQFTVCSSLFPPFRLQKSNSGYQA